MPFRIQNPSRSLSGLFHTPIARHSRPRGLRFRHSTGIFWDISCKMTSAITAALREASGDQAAARKSGSLALPAAVYLQLCTRCALLVKIADWSGVVVAAMTDVRMRCQRRNYEMKGMFAFFMKIPVERKASLWIMTYRFLPIEFSSQPSSAGSSSRHIFQRCYSI